MSFLTRQVTIKLAGVPKNSAPIIYPGSIIYGSVEYKSPGEDRVRSITIDFRGFSKVKRPVKVGQLTHESTELFHEHQSLYVGEQFTFQDAPRGAIEIPFSFMVPTMTTTDCTGKYGRQSDEHFVETPHLLPPTVAVEKGDAQVVYHMYAIVRRYTHGTMSEGVKDAISIHDIDTFKLFAGVYEQSAVEEQLVERPLSFSRPHSGRLFSFGRRSSVQSVHVDSNNYRIEVATMPVIIAGRPCQISTTIRKSSNSAEGPGRIFELSSIVLVARTSSRTRDQSVGKASVEESVSKQLMSQGQFELPLDRAVTHNISSQSLSDWPPSFKSYSISRAYTLRIQISSTTELSSNKETADIQVPVTLVCLYPEDVFEGLGVLTESTQHVPPPEYEDSPPYDETMIRDH